MKDLKFYLAVIVLLPITGILFIAERLSPWTFLGATTFPRRGN